MKDADADELEALLGLPRNHSPFWAQYHTNAYVHALATIVVSQARRLRELEGDGCYPRRWQCVQCGWRTTTEPLSRCTSCASV